MTLREFYDRTGGDYEGVLSRVLDEGRIRKYVKMFKNDPCYGELEMFLEKGNVEQAFRASHTLKGVCLNIGFNRLYSYTNTVTEALRSKDLALACENMPNLRASYKEIIEGIDAACAEEV